MKNLFGYADKYLQKSDWKDIALLKFCLFSMGVLMGILIGRRGQIMSSTEKGSDGCNACFYRHVYSIDDKIFWNCDGKRRIAVGRRKGVFTPLFFCQYSYFRFWDIY